MADKKKTAQTAIQNICLLRLSAVGDICHTLPVVRTLQAALPRARITWIIGKTEYSLVSDMANIEFIIFDKSKKWRAYQAVRQQLAGRRFDVLLHMQMSLRASMISLLVNSPRKLGFDKQRAKDLQWLFTNERIEYKPRQHVIDSFFGFTEALGISEHLYQWDIPIPESDRAFAAQHLSASQPVLVISPCSSMAYRNWNTAGYVAVAEYAVAKHGMQVVLTGGPSAIEKQYAEAIRQQVQVPVTDLIGQTSLKQLLAVLSAATAIVAPDAGPAHMGTAVGTPVIGLYATTNPDRARPYLSAEFTVNRYAEAIRDKFGKAVDEVPWGTRVREAGTMDRITVADVTGKLDQIMEWANL
ncbi:MAG: glycosyltransferase family 9 protein [Gammaproteobacteria bacterium]|nr:glycosyltransferase family 9 protein [Gammaproteobacteria bacterium]MDH5651848.1 glycosyltransferase family 9 protein [Gammaproteobacteria bacterium]